MRGVVMFSKLNAVAALVLFSLIASVPARAQVSGATLSGSVTDQNGSSVPNATITITNKATGITRAVTADSAGFYSAPNLTPGGYEVTISAPGFSTQVQKDITLTVGAQQSLNPVLKVGQVSQRIEVTGEAAQVELSSSAVSAEVNETTVRELPLNGRDWSSLAVLEPGVIGIRSQLGTTGTVNRGNRGFGNQLATDGHRPSENTYRVNGINVNDYSNGSPGSVEGKQLGVDGIQEFTVVTTNYSAEYGRTSGAVINAVLKQGANNFHGDVYWFLRDEGMDAKNFFDTSKTIAPFHRNQMGGSAGGPIVKNKTFFFADYEGIRQTRSGTARNTVPSANARIGKLCSTGAASCGGAQYLVSSLPASINDTVANGGNGTDPTTGIDLVTAKYLALWPTPDPTLGTDATGNFGYTVTNPLQIYTENYFTTRVDHKISDKDSLDGFYFYDKSPQVTPDNFLLATSQTVSSRQMLGFEETHIFSTTLVNTFRAGYNRSVGLVGKPGTALQPIAADTSLGVGSGRVAPLISIGGGISTMGGGLNSLAQYNHIMNSFQYNDDAFITRGLHSIKFGGFVERLQGHEFTIQRPNGTFGFNNLTDFLTNIPHSLSSIGSTAVGKPYGARITFLGGYVQDDWKYRPNLTFNIGVRYEMATLPTEVHGTLSVIQNVYGGPRVSVTHPWQSNATTKNFAPRVGFAWDPFRNGKTSVRGGFGIFDILPGTWVGFNQETGSYPYALTLSYQGTPPPYSFATPAAILTGANQTNPTAATIAKAQGWAPEQNPKRNYAMNWNMNVQRQLTSSLTATVGYVGMHTVHSPFTTDQSNFAPPIPGTNYWPVTPGSILDPNVGALRPTFWMVSSRYNGIQARISDRMSHGLQASLSYTYGKCNDDTSSGLIGDPFQNSFTTTLFDLPLSRRGPCDFNITNNLVASVIYNIPGPKTGVMSYLAGGWQTGGIVTVSTGIPTTPFIGGDPLGLINADAAVYPDYIPGCNRVNPNWKSTMVYINSACYTPPVAPAAIASDPTKCTAYTNTTVANTCAQLFGNAGRNSIVGPSSFNLDFSMFKNFPVHKISESFNVQFRAEFFNVLNHPNFLLPNFNEGNNQVIDGGAVASAGGAPNGGLVPAVIDKTGTYDPRQIQLGLKIVW